MPASIDLVLRKRRPGDDRGRLVWRDRLAWIGAPATRLDPAQPLPLILFNRAQHHPDGGAGGAGTRRPTWRIVCTSGSLSGLRAAALAGLGVTVHARGLMPEGLSEMPAAYRLPDLGDVEFVVLGAARREHGTGGRTGRRRFWPTVTGCSGGSVSQGSSRRAAEEA